MTTQSSKKYRRLMEKAKELFFTQGYKRVTMDEIAAEAGISKMTIYKYFSSKEDLLLEVIIQWSDQILSIIHADLDKIPTAVEKIEYMFSFGASVSKEMPFVLYKDIMESPYIIARLGEYKKKEVLVLWKNILEEGVNKGEMRPMDVDFVSHFLSDLTENIDWQRIFANPYYLNEEKGVSWLVENIYDFFKYGLLGRGKG
ncbi:AcrR family transcriptional regulator [Anaerosolibacter carboniphilus]|uniref:AcrR family transcriptional regulator n=1 Tax=Anaerosolibacter carboniphilus TaxID=1417629 RepID=A0A841KKY6_9FIRM|nr:TetR/AcrR family transcriptional regulator [Anaerosolibacter carboniphilus]MBB6214006.1 AcrR family transcriptional regulator [Anaerosolibacter carboniphilus]